MTRDKLVYGSFWRQALDLFIFTLWVAVAVVLVTIPIVVGVTAGGLLVLWIWDVLS